MELVTGRAGSPHITAQQDRQLHQGIWGEEAYILNTGNMLEPEVQSSNKILIKDGALMFQGALFSVKVGTTDEITINNGNQGLLRKDTVAIRYHYDSAQNEESAEWIVFQGTAVSSNPIAPSGISGNIQDGDTYVDCPVYIVSLNGINITAVDKVPEIAPDIPTLNASLSEITGLLSPNISTIYTSANGTVEGFKIGRLAVVRISAIASDSVERQINYNADYAPAVNSTFLPLARNGVMLGSSVLSRESSTGRADFRYKAPSGNAGTYTGWVVYATYS